jgi:gamma-glutamyltranspeptidase/glutathione hydrolase
MLRGGSMMDAAIAASAVLAVTATHANSIGSDGFALLYSGGKMRALNGSGAAPLALKADRFTKGIPSKGPIAAVTPGLPRIWETLHARGGRLPWSSLFNAAIAAAESHEVSPVLLRNLATDIALLRADPGCAAVYLREGTPIPIGALLRQPALADTLRAVADFGADAFHTGEIARTLSAAVRASGGLLSETDLANYQPEWTEALTTNYRGLTVHAVPPNAYGVLMLAQLNALQSLPKSVLAGDRSAVLAMQIRATFAAIAEVKPRICDPRWRNSRQRAADLDAMLGPAVTARLCAALSQTAHAVDPPTAGGTTGLVIVDGESGDALVMLQSNFQPFGCAFLDPTTGVLLNNRMMCFTHDPADVNAVAPGKRPAHTHNPLMLTAPDGNLRMAIATPGGISQNVTCVQVLVNRLDRNLSLADSVDTPRWSTDRFGGRVIESEFPYAMAAQLALHGQPVTTATGSNFFGSVKVVERAADGTLTGHADHRRQATVAGS